jgi:hypothetical protein
VVITDCTWSRGSSFADRLIVRAGSRLIDGPHVTYCVLSSGECTTFPQTWGVRPTQVVFTPFCHTLTEDELNTPTAVDGGVFAGGDSFRDYETLIEAMRGLPATATLASGQFADRHDLPANVRAGRVPHRRFVELLAGASVVVVPLVETVDRSAGQQTYLNAMALGKPVIVTDVLGARDYIEDGRTGVLTRPRDPVQLAAALRWALNRSRRDVPEMAARAREVARTRFTSDNYLARVLAVAESAAEAGSR